MKLIHLFLLLVLFHLPSTFATAQELCLSEEKVIFSCSTGKKSVSLCASMDLSPTSGYLQYRFGASKEDVQLIYPKDRGHPKNYFNYRYYGWAKGSDSRVSFTIGEYTYTVFRFQSVFEGNEAGVEIYKSSQKMGFLKCQESTINEDLYFLKDIIPTDMLISYSL